MRISRDKAFAIMATVRQLNANNPAEQRFRALWRRFVNEPSRASHDAMLAALDTLPDRMAREIRKAWRI